MFRDDVVVTDQVILKGRHVVIPDRLQKQALVQLHINHMGIEKRTLLAGRSIYLTGMSNDVGKFI